MYTGSASQTGLLADPSSCALGEGRPSPPGHGSPQRRRPQEPWARRLHLTVTFYILHKQKAQLHTHTVWKAHSDRLLEVLLSPEEALAGARFFVGMVVIKCAGWCHRRLHSGAGRAADTTPDPQDGLIGMDSGPGLSPLEQL